MRLPALLTIKSDCKPILSAMHEIECTVVTSQFDGMWEKAALLMVKDSCTRNANVSQSSMVSLNSPHRGLKVEVREYVRETRCCYTREDLREKN